MKRAVILLLVLCLLCVPQAPAARAASDVCFIALNDTLPEQTGLAYVQRSTVYVPYSVFESFLIYNTYYSGGNTASLFTSDKQLYFDITNATAYDGEGNYYSTSAIMRGSVVYVSVSFVCAQFGLSWSYISGNGYGDICRIKDGGAFLTDAQFLSAASIAMTNRYNAYMGLTTPDDGPGSHGSAGEREGCDLYLSFQGLPSPALLDSLKKHGVQACFFLTSEEVAGNPDRVRRIAGEGHSLGVLCAGAPEEEYAETAALIFEAARLNTLLIASASREYDEACKSAAEELGLVFWDYALDGVNGGEGLVYSALLTIPLGFYYDRADARILCCDATDASMESALSYIVSNSYNIRCPRETGSNF